MEADDEDIPWDIDGPTEEAAPMRRALGTGSNGEDDSEKEPDWTFSLMDRSMKRKVGEGSAPSVKRAKVGKPLVARRGNAPSDVVELSSD